MDKRKVIKTKLKRLKQSRIYLEKLEEDLKLLEMERHLKGTSYDNPGGGSGGISDVTGSTATSIADREKELKLKICKVRNEISLIERTLKSLHEEERAVVTSIYMDDKQYWQVARELMISVSTVKRRRESAYDKMLKGMFGEE